MDLGTRSCSEHSNIRSVLTDYYKERESDWNVQLLDREVFDPFYKKSIVEECYQETDKMKVRQFLSRILELSYAISLYDSSRRAMFNGSACHCLLNSFCLLGECPPARECRNLFKSIKKVSKLQPTFDIIPYPNTREAVVSSIPRNVSISPQLFHLIHTTEEESFGTMQKRCLESIFYHHPNARVILHAKYLTKEPVQYLINAGYNVSVEPYDPIESLKQVRQRKIFPDHLIKKFMRHIEGYASDPGGNWFSNESNLLRMILMYLDGGIYLGKTSSIASIAVMYHPLKHLLLP